MPLQQKKLAICLGDLTAGVPERLDICANHCAQSSVYLHEQK